MAARFIDINDFSGQFDVDENFFDETIVEKEEEQILRDLLGDYQYRLFIADCGDDDEPATLKYEYLLNGSIYTNGYEIDYKGLIDMLVAFCFSQLVREVRSTTGTGFVKPDNQNSRPLNSFEKKALANSAYNIGVNYYKQAQEYILFNNADFLRWNTKVKNYRNLIEY